MQRLVLLIVCTVGCGSRSFVPCDIREAQCHQSLALALGERRGDVQVAPVVEIRTRDEVLAERTASATDDERIAFARANAILALFSLAQPGLTLEDREAVDVDDLAAYYTASTKTVTIVDRGLATDSASASLSFVHELVHALQDSDGFLELAFADTNTTDRTMARRAVVEGEATLYQAVAALDMYGWHPSDARVQAALNEITAHNDVARVDGGSQIYETTTRFVYPYGHAYLRPRYDRDGQVGIASVYFNLPDTAYEIMTGAAPAERLGDEAIAIRKPEDTTVIADSFGLYNVRTWCDRELYSTILCEDALDDAFTGIMPADGSPAIGVWRIRFATPVRDELVDALREAGYNATVAGHDLIVVRDAIGRGFDPSTFITAWRGIAP